MGITDMFFSFSLMEWRFRALKSNRYFSKPAVKKVVSFARFFDLSLIL